MIIDHVYRVYPGYIFGLPPHFLHTGKHIPVLIDLDELLCHQTTGRILIIAQELYNITGMGLAGFGLLSPKYCAVGMVFSNLVVIFNSIYGMQLPDREAASRRR